MKAKVEALYSLSRQQQGALFECLSAPDTGLHVEQVSFFWVGAFNYKFFQESWKILIANHPILRTAFVWKKRETPVQAVLAAAVLDSRREDWRRLSEAARRDRWGEALERERRKPFDFAKAPLLRTLCVDWEEGRSRLAVTMHHLLVDGWSLGLLFGQFLEGYGAVARGESWRPPPAPPFREYIRWLQKQDMAAARQFWRDYLSDAEPAAVKRKPLPPPGDDDFGEAELVFSATESADLAAFANRNKLTLNSLFQSFWALALCRRRESTDLVFGVTASGRSADLPGVERMIGLLIATLPCRALVDREAPTIDWLRDEQARHRQMLAYEYCSPGQIREWIGASRAEPLFDTLLVFENYPLDRKRQDQLTQRVNASIEGVAGTGAKTRHVLTILIEPVEPIRLKAVYDARQLNRAYAARALADLRDLAATATANPRAATDSLIRVLPASPPIEPEFAEAAAPADPEPAQPPETEMEQTLAELWSALFSGVEIGRNAHFFKLGGHSLLAARLTAAIGEKLGVPCTLSTLFANPRLRDLARALAHDQPGPSAAVDLPKAEPDPGQAGEPFPLTDVQRAYWIGRRETFALGKVGTHAYFELDCGPLDTARINHCWNRLIERHGMLRAVVDESGRQRILPETPPYFIRVEDLSKKDEAARQAALADTRARLEVQVFNPAHWPMFEIRATILDSGRTRLHFSFDLLIADAASFAILAREWNLLYEDPSRSLPALSLTFRDYVLAAARLRDTTAYAEARRYWLARLPTLPPGPALPLARRPQSVARPEFRRRQEFIRRDVWQSLKRRSQALGVSPSTAVLAGFAETLASWSDSPRFCLNLTLFNRKPLHPEANDIVGDFTSLTALDASSPPATPFAARARLLQERLWRDLERDAFSGVEVMRAMAERGGERREAPFPVVFTSVLGQTGAGDGGAERLLDGELAYAIGQTSQVWLDCQVQEDGHGGLLYVWDAVEALFPEGMLDDMFGAAVSRLKTLARHGARWQEPGQAVIPLWQRPLLDALNATAASFPAERLHDGWRRQARRAPQRTAVIAPDRSLSYGDLDQWSAKIARVLRRRGAGPEAPVAIVIEKGWKQAAAALGVLRAGAAYVPVSPDLPPARRLALMTSSGAEMALTTAAFLASADWQGPAQAIAVDALTETEREAAGPVDWPPDPAGLAYVIYTSGSTGQPKGVAIAHMAAANTIHDLNSRFHVSEKDRALGVSSLSFDLSVYDLFGLWAAGGATVLPAPSQAPDPAAWAERIETCGVTLWSSVPALLQLLAAETSRSGRPETLASLRLALLSGDWIPLDLADAVRALNPRLRTVSLGGATEASIWSIFHEIEAIAPEWKSVPYGKPLHNQQFHPLGPDLAPRPLHAVGELFIGGAGLARCYWRAPALTAERFIPHPATGERLYRTGDLGRLAPEGHIEFLGRNDRQVKIRGFRVELGEAEHGLKDCGDVAACAVVACGDRFGDRFLAAYVQLARQDEDHAAAEERLRAGLASRLPAHLTPSAFVFIDRMPLSPNGKVDVKALPEPAAASPAPAPETSRTTTPSVELIAGVWAQVLDLPAVGPDDDFFALGGNSLTAARAVSRLRALFATEIPFGAMFEQPRPTDLAGRVETLLRQGEPPPSPIEAISRQGPLAMSFAQERLWFYDRLEPGDPAYNLPLALQLEGLFDLALAEGCFLAIAERHESLRARFGLSNERPVQWFDAQPRLDFPVVDLRGLPAEAREPATARLLAESARQPFDLEAGGLLRLLAVRLDETSHALLINVHHIVSDGWSLKLTLDELNRRYLAGLANQPAELPTLPIQYADYACWQRSELRGETLSRRLAFWEDLLAGAPAASEFPTDRPRPAARASAGRLYAFALERDLTRRTREFARAAGATPFMPLLAAFAALLGRCADQADLVIGVSTANRGRHETESLIGFFTNTLPLRLTLKGAPSLSALTAQTRRVSLAAFARQDVSFEQIVERVQPERDLSRTPLFQTLFTVENIGVNEEVDRLTAPGLSARWRDHGHSAAKYDLSMHLNRRGDEYTGLIEYNTALFEAASIARLARRYAMLLSALTDNPEGSVFDPSLLTPAERQETLAVWNDTETPYPPEPTIHALFENRSAQAPEAPAIVGEDGEWSYAELNRRADAIAAALRRRGAGPESIVGVCLPRGGVQIAALLGILKAGAVYAPLDPDYPSARLAFMLEDAGVAHLVAIQETLDRLPAQQTLFIDTLLLDEPPDIERGYRSAALPGLALAYLMYTSGSTGQPKGVAIPHRAVIRLAVTGGFARLDRRETTLYAAPLAFDASTFEIWGALLNGARLRPAPADALPRLPDLVAEGGVTTLWLTSQLFNWMTDCHLEAFAGVRQVLAGGEALSPRHVRLFLERWPDKTLLNGYGPTEATVFACVAALQEKDLSCGSAPIGRPIGNTRAFVVDGRLRLIPPGARGELTIGGDGLARGYWNRPALTAERFIPDPFSARPGARLYRTGDLARPLPDGRLLFAGRRDSQVKIRGYRIELGEIEQALESLEGVSDAAAAYAAKGGDKPRLLAYATAAPQATIHGDRLRRLLAEKLPDYMTPEAIVIVEALPLTPNGKVDIEALPAPDPGPMAGREPHTPTEAVTALIWAEALGRQRIFRDDHFFDLGGHSLLAMQALSRVRERLNAVMPLRALFEHPVLADFAATIDAARRGDLPEEPPIEPVARDRALPLSFSQERLWFLDRLEPDSAAYNIPALLRVDGALDVNALRACFDEVIARHEILRTRFPEKDGAPQAEIAARAAAHFTIHDFRELPETKRERACREQVVEEAHRPFSLAEGPLMRVTVYRLDDRRNVLLVNIHHIIADGWSLKVLFRELAALYQSFFAEEPTALEPLPIQYGDFAAWQRRLQDSAAGRTDLDYWTRQLADPPAELDLPLDKPRPAAQTYRGRIYDFHLTGETTTAMHELCRRESATPFMALLAAYAALLSRYTRQRDLCVGTPVANRNRLALEPLIGFFANTLALRIDVSGDPSFAALLARVRRTALEGFARQDAPFEKVVERLQPERDMSRTPLFQTMFSLDNIGILEDERAFGAEGLDIGVMDYDYRIAKFDLSLDMMSGDGTYMGRFEYNTDLLEEAAAVRMAGHFQNLLDSTMARPDLAVSRAELLTGEERERLLIEWNHTAEAYPTLDDACELLVRQAASRPDAPAIICGSRVYSFEELIQRAGRAARVLREAGVGPERTAAICGAHTPATIIGLFGVLMAGGCWLPIDPSYPEARARFMIEDAGAVALLSEPGLADGIGDGLATIDLERLAETGGEPAPARQAWGSQAAYVIYTSGSTGTPKGVCVSHASLAGFAIGAASRYGLTDRDRMLQFSSLGFDIAVEEIFTTLAAGAALVTQARDRALALDELLALVERQEISALDLPTAYWHEWTRDLIRTDASLPASLRLVIIGGEEAKASLWRRWQRLPGSGQVALLNTYGPTEATVAATWHPLDSNAASQASGGVPIGRPMPNARAYVLDRLIQPAPPGVVGELFLGGPGVSRGYLNQPSLTAQRFMPDPFAPSDQPGARLFRTGDLVRLRADGELGFVGRVDFQIKIRGHRVEIAEIENALLEHPEVDNAAVAPAAGVDGAPRLVAYVEVGDDAPSPGALRDFLRRTLPEYMTPSAFALLPEMPLTSDGKVDRAALPEPEALPVEAQREYAPPSTPAEAAVVTIWQSLLGCERVGVHDNFFDLGGHSLLVTRVISRLRDSLAVSLSTRMLFEHPVAADLAAYIDFVQSTADKPLAEDQEFAEEGEI